VSCTALQCSCTQQLYGIAARALVTVNSATAALSPVCTFASQPTVSQRIIAFVDDTRLAHFVGTASPVMELLSLSNTGTTTCIVSAVSAYPAAASVLEGTPVLAAHRDVNSVTPQVLVVAGSPSKLYTVTAAGAISQVASLLKARDSTPVTPYGLTVTGTTVTQCGIPPGVVFVAATTATATATAIRSPTLHP
jgi:hypothetical protein